MIYLLSGVDLTLMNYVLSGVDMDLMKLLAIRSRYVINETTCYQDEIMALVNYLLSAVDMALMNYLLKGL